MRTGLVWTPASFPALDSGQPLVKGAVGNQTVLIGTRVASENGREQDVLIHDPARTYLTRKRSDSDSLPPRIQCEHSFRVYLGSKARDVSHVPHAYYGWVVSSPFPCGPLKLLVVSALALDLPLVRSRSAVLGQQTGGPLRGHGRRSGSSRRYGLPPEGSAQDSRLRAGNVPILFGS